IENQAYVVGVNRVGEGGGLAYAGDSAVIGPFGEELADGADLGEAVLLADVDPAHVAEGRERFPFLQDRRRPFRAPTSRNCVASASETARSGRNFVATRARGQRC